MTEKPPILSVLHVWYKYPNTHENVLKDITFSVQKGEIVGLMGSNGAGKTTLIKMFNGLLRPTRGSIFYKGNDINTESTASLSKEIGLVFQNPNHQLFSNTVEDEIKFSLKSTDINKEEYNKIIQSILTDFDLNQYKTRSPLNLSGGEMKKLSVASIICRDPEILIFDEPTIGQDYKNNQFFLKLLEKEKKKKKTIIIVTHDVEFAMEHLPRIILMQKGEILADGPTRLVLKNKALIKKGSLILPQIYSFKESLEQMGIKITKEIHSPNDMIQFIQEFLKTRGNS